MRRDAHVASRRDTVVLVRMHAETTRAMGCKASASAAGPGLGDPPVASYCMSGYQLQLCQHGATLGQQRGRCLGNSGRGATSAFGNLHRCGITVLAADWFGCSRLGRRQLACSSAPERFGSYRLGRPPGFGLRSARAAAKTRSRFGSGAGQGVGPARPAQGASAGGGG